ncbi:MAG TPA: PAS domain S-box protein, partial [Bacteroidetes bacterium]|nr:PAS domain S-box protein [Bacteroidota bacterium]
ILLDIIMPGMDGFEVCRRLKQNEKLKHIPVVFLTALKTSAANRIKALEAGGDGLLPKPVNQQELIAQLRAMKKIKEAASREKQQKEILEAMVTERTRALEAEIKLRINTEQELRKSEKELRKSEERYRIVSNLTSDYIFQTRIKPDGTSEKTWVAGSFEQITGYTFEEYLKRGGWQKLLHPADREKDRRAFEKLRKNQKTSIEVRLVHKTGKIIWVRSSGFPVWDEENNRLISVVGAVKDITIEKLHYQMQEVLFGVTKKILTATDLSGLYASVQQELNKVMDATNFMVVAWNEATRTFSAKYGKDEKELVTHYAAEGTLSQQVIQQQKPLFLKKKDILSMEKKGTISLIGTLPEIWMGVPLFRKEKVYGVMIAQHYDNPQAYDWQTLQIFEAVANELSMYLGRKETEEENASLSLAIQQSLVGTLITSREGIIQFVNPALCRITGLSKEEMLGKDSRILLPKARPANFIEDVSRHIENGQSWKGEVFHKDKIRNPRWVNTIISPVFDEKKQVVQIVALLEDISEKKRNELFQEIQFNIAHGMVTSATLHDLFLIVKR